MVRMITVSPSKVTVSAAFSTTILPWEAWRPVLFSLTREAPTLPSGSWILIFLPKTFPTTMSPSSAVIFAPFSILYLFSNGLRNLKSPCVSMMFVK